VWPKNYRRIALYALETADEPILLVNGKRETDFSETGPLTQKRMRRMIDFEIRDGVEPILMFHDHPNEMGIAENYESLARHCEEEGWLRIQRAASA
jgi:hypothetical protein